MKKARKIKKSVRKGSLDSCGDPEFFQGKSLSELAREQGVGPVKDISVFAGVIGEDEDVDEMIKELYRLREPPIRRQRSAAASRNPKGSSPWRAGRGNTGKGRTSTDKKP
jgi:hypothetical protein